MRIRPAREKQLRLFAEKTEDRRLQEIFRELDATRDTTKFSSAMITELSTVNNRLMNEVEKLKMNLGPPKMLKENLDLKNRIMKLRERLIKASIFYPQHQCLRIINLALQDDDKLEEGQWQS